MLTHSLNVNLSGAPALIAILVFFFVVFAIVTLFLSPFFIAAALLRKRAESILRDRQGGTVIAQYDPPKGFSPAQAGFLYNMKCNEKEIYATLFQLQQRGVITFDTAHRITVVDQASFAQLETYEQVAVRMFDTEGTLQNDTVNTLPVTFYGNNGVGQTIHIKMPPAKSKYAFTKAVQASLYAKGIRLKGYRRAFVTRVIILTFLIGLVPGIASACTAILGHAGFGAVFESFMASGVFFLLVWPIYTLFAYLIVRLYVAIAGRIWLNTKQVRELWPEIEGYRLFLKTAELGTIQSDDEAGAQVSKAMPYAIVFDLDTKWQWFGQSNARS